MEVLLTDCLQAVQVHRKSNKFASVRVGYDPYIKQWEAIAEFKDDDEPENRIVVNHISNPKQALRELLEKVRYGS